MCSFLLFLVAFRTRRNSPSKKRTEEQGEEQGEEGEGGGAEDTMLVLLDPEEGKDAKIDNIEMYKLKRLVEENKDLHRKLSETTQELDRVK